MRTAMEPTLLLINFKGTTSVKFTSMLMILAQKFKELWNTQLTWT